MSFEGTGQPKLQPFDLQVAGHDGVLAAEDNQMVFKPMNPRELQFYQQTLSQGCQPLLDFMPKFYGTLERKDQNAQTYICLENITGGEFERPCVLDIKLGKRTYDLDALPEKRERMIYKASQTTSSSLGVALCGMAVAGQPKEDRDGLRGLTPVTIGEMLDKYFVAAAVDVSEEYRRYILGQFITEVEEYKEMVKRLEVRMYASSLLFVYDACKERYEEFKGTEDMVLLDVRAIDFAHSHWVPGEGPDINLLEGLDGLLKLLKECQARIA